MRDCSERLHQEVKCVIPQSLATSFLLLSVNNKLQFQLLENMSELASHPSTLQDFLVVEISNWNDVCKGNEHSEQRPRTKKKLKDTKGEHQKSLGQTTKKLLEKRACHTLGVVLCIGQEKVKNHIRLPPPRRDWSTAFAFAFDSCRVHVAARVEGVWSGLFRDLALHDR